MIDAQTLRRESAFLSMLNKYFDRAYDAMWKVVEAAAGSSDFFNGAKQDALRALTVIPLLMKIENEGPDEFWNEPYARGAKAMLGVDPNIVDEEVAVIDAAEAYFGTWLKSVFERPEFFGSFPTGFSETQKANLIKAFEAARLECQRELRIR
jgi:hypothetical protein